MVYTGRTAFTVIETTITTGQPYLKTCVMCVYVCGRGERFIQWLCVFVCVCVFGGTFVHALMDLYRGNGVYLNQHLYGPLPPPCFCTAQRKHDGLWPSFLSRIKLFIKGDYYLYHGHYYTGEILHSHFRKYFYSFFCWGPTLPLLAYRLESQGGCPVIGRCLATSYLTRGPVISWSRVVIMRLVK